MIIHNAKKKLLEVADTKSVLLIRSLIKDLFDIKTNADIDGAVEYIKSNINFRGPNAWTLIFAIIIASVGLSINSIPAIIGAMLISPLMGPIIGVGFSLGTYNYILLKRSIKNLLIFVVISILASMLYFLFSPTPSMQAELLARTKPSFFDVLIAFFGGSAGIIAISRKEKGTVIAGMAVATALMPPLCTAGFALATHNFVFFVGALYLFVINCVFISIATFIFVKYLHFPKMTHMDLKTTSYANKVIAYVGFIVLIPSFFMAWYLQRESSFLSKANSFIKSESQNGKIIVIEKEVAFSLNTPKIKLTLLGDDLDKNKLEKIKQNGKLYSIPYESIEIKTSSITDSLSRKFNTSLGDVERNIKELQIRAEHVEQKISEAQAIKEKNALDGKEKEILFQAVILEAKIIFPNIQQVYFIESEDFKISHKTLNKPEIITIWKRKPKRNELIKANKFLQQRFGSEYECCSNLVMS